MKAIILAAGKGTRMYPLTITRPKLLLPVLNETILDHFVRILNGYVDEVVLVVSEFAMAHEIRDYIEKKKYPLKFDFVYQEKQLGTGHAVQCAKNVFAKGEEFLLMNGDDLYSKETIEEVMNSTLAATYYTVEDPERWGIHRRDKQGFLKELVEKPQEHVGYGANTGLYKLNARIFELFKETEISPRGEYEITDGINLLTREAKVKSIETINYWIPVGYPWHLLSAQEKLIDSINFDMENEKRSDISVNGELKLGKGTILKNGCSIEGKVIIGENTIIGPNAVIIGPTSIGSNCKIMANSVVERSIIMDGTIINPLTQLSDGICGQNTVLGSGSIAANTRFDGKEIKVSINDKLENTGRVCFSTIIGDEAKLGVSTSIYPGRRIWPNKKTLPGEIITRDVIN